MGNFANNSITDSGRMLLAAAQLGGEFDATRIVIGSGYIPSGKTAATMSAVVTPVISLQINKKDRSPDGKVIFGGYYSNKDITDAFYFRELALYARIIKRETDGTITVLQDETCYSYGNAGASADLMPAYGTSTVVERQMDLVTWIGNDTTVNLSIDSGVFVTHPEMNSAVAAAEARMVERYDDIDFRMGRDISALGDRMDAAEIRIDGHDGEIEALKANDVTVHARLNEVASRSDAIWEALFSDITENPAIVDFDDLSGITLTGGVWNRPLRRLEV